MSAQAPQVLSRRTNGVLHPGANQINEISKKKAAVESSATRPPRGKGSSDKGSDVKSTNDAETPKAPRTRTPSEGEKVVIRRLPPGMTQAEFVSILGQEWEVGKGKVDWFYFARGKVSNDSSKPMRPGRAYLHLMRKEYVLPLSEVVRAATWEDAKNTFTSTSLVGPPSLEFSAYKKVPGSKKRTDARQGTIDQDPEFMAFLEGLANPAPPRDILDNEETEETSKTEITTTPLIEYLKEKKANKIKEAAAAKSAKHSRPETSSKGKAAAKEDDGSKKKSKESKSSKSDKGPSKEPVKILTKKVAVEQAAEAAKNAANQIPHPSSGSGTNTKTNSIAAPAAATSSAPTTSAASTEAPPKSRRAGIAQAARILQRDLGLSPGSAHRRARQDAAKADADSKSNTDSKANTNGKDAAPATNGSQSSTAQSVEPANPQPSKAQSTTSNTSKSQSSGRRARGSGKNSEKGKNAESMSTENLITPPVILKKKPTNDVEASRATSTTTSHTPAPQSNAGSGKSNANSNAASGSKNSSQQKSSAPAKKNKVSVAANAVRGFIKHANASQGITEAALRQALEICGAVTLIEMDKRKGFAYVDFAEHAGLVKAISSSPLTVAQGTIQVLERKDKKPTTSGGGGGGSNTATPAAPIAAASSNHAASSEKSTSRGRRGRGGGNKNNAATNGSQTAAAAAAAASGDASTTNGAG